MFAFAPSMCLFCDCSLVCELQADVVQFSSICVYGVNIRCIWVFYFSRHFICLLKHSHFSSFFIWNISRSASPSAVRWRKLLFLSFSLLRSPFVAKEEESVSTQHLNTTRYCFLFYVFDYVISLEGEMFSHFCLSAVVILNFLSVFFTESSII